MSEYPYTAETTGFIVRVRPHYLADQSDPDERRWLWAYQVEIVNASAGEAQLVARAWTITDANGKVETVAGPGVVGEQPTLNPGDAYSYTSGWVRWLASSSWSGRPASGSRSPSRPFPSTCRARGGW
jgi:ApaG protein